MTISTGLPDTLINHPEIWGGVECTVNRVHDQYFDQLARTQHRTRMEDLERFAALGIVALRFPILWEHVQLDEGRCLQWDWPDRAMRWLRDHSIHPIVGLLHHGSGPRWTSLLDTHFPKHFAQYARRVAERYPWATSYTPINEPLTTARFSGLYGHWYPHNNDATTFLKILLNQCRAVVLAMHEIRQVRPEAKLVQTEDLGKISSTRLLAYQRHFENNRRWLTWDLLCGKVTPDHPLCDYIVTVMDPSSGIVDDLKFFIDHPTPPDIIGINHYLTSERFLDDDVSRYPEEMHGGNGIHTYVDIATVRSPTVRPVGIGSILQEAWQRYHIPLAITECHLGCTREEQMRWLFEVWNAAVQLRAQGVDVRAVTAWSLLGSFDWDSLVTRVTPYYEPGVFDVRSHPPRSTRIARMIHDLATTGSYQHPVLHSKGWWHHHSSLGSETNDRPLLIVGTMGILDDAFARICKERGISYHALTWQDIDIKDRETVQRSLQQYNPWAVINTTGYEDIDQAEREQARCFLENTDSPVILAQGCQQRGIQFVTFSTDLVFDGEKQAPYMEHDTVSPLNTYGLSKVVAESLILQIMPAALILRTGVFFSPWDERNYVARALQALCDGICFPIADDVIITPTYIPDLVHTTLDLLLDEECGVWHLSNPTPVTWNEFLAGAAQLLNIDPYGLDARPTHAMEWVAHRPAYSALTSIKGTFMPTLDSALQRFANSRASTLIPVSASSVSSLSVSPSSSNVC
jgi:dTDP-4-dehydrorhamnose reductase